MMLSENSTHSFFVAAVPSGTDVSEFHYAKKILVTMLWNI